jgi:hypothetical protein
MGTTMSTELAIRIRDFCSATGAEPRSRRPMRVMGVGWMVRIVWIMRRGMGIMRMRWMFTHDHIKDHLTDLSFSGTMVRASDFEDDNPVIRFRINNLCMATAPLTSEQVLLNEVLALFDESQWD